MSAVAWKILVVALLLLWIVVLFWYTTRTRIGGVQNSEGIFLAQLISRSKTNERGIDLIKFNICQKGNLAFPCQYLKAEVSSAERNFYISHIDGVWELVSLGRNGERYPTESL